MSMLYLLSSRLFGNIVQKILIPDVQKVRKIIVVIYKNVLDCVRSLFSLNIHGKEHKTSEPASVSVLFSVIQWSFVMHSFGDTSNNIYMQMLIVLTHSVILLLFVFVAGIWDNWEEDLCCWNDQVTCRLS